MDDVITEAPPPSRFLEEDLNSFTPPSPPLNPPPALHFPSPQQQQQEALSPALLIIALSPPSLSLFHPHLLPPSKPLLASLTLPNANADITLSTLTPHSLLLSVPSPVPSHHAHALARALIGDPIRPRSVLIFGSLSPSNHRGRLSADEAVAFKLETSVEKRTAEGKKILEGLEYYPSGSVVDGLAAAVLGRCQVLNLRATLCVSWPEFDRSVMSLIEGLLRNNGVLRGEDLRFGSQVLRFGRRKGRGLESELYT